MKPPKLSARMRRLLEIRALAHTWSWYVRGENYCPAKDTYWLLYLRLLSAERKAMGRRE